MHPRPPAVILVAALLAAILAAACRGAAPGAAAVGTPGLPAAGSVVAVPGTPIAVPSVTPTPAVSGEPIASTAALPRNLLPPVEFWRDGRVIATLPIEVPPPSEYTIGLSGRLALSDERGMLFYYTRVGRGAFWMKDTHFDLAIAFVAADESIVDIVEMQRESTAIVTPKADYQYAIEAPAGWYLQHGVRLGDRAHLAFPLPRSLTSQ